MLKKRVVASLVGNLSPLKTSIAMRVRRTLHFRGEMGEVLKTRASWNTRVRSCLKEAGPDSEFSSSFLTDAMVLQTEKGCV